MTLAARSRPTAVRDIWRMAFSRCGMLLRAGSGSELASEADAEPVMGA